MAALVNFVPVYYYQMRGVDEYTRWTLRTWALMFFGFVIIVVALSVIVRRFHDLGWRGWWAAGFVPLSRLSPKLGLVLLLALALIPGRAAENKFGLPQPSLRQFFAARKVVALGKKFSAGKITAEEFNGARQKILAALPQQE
jgi:uncharacterized membrane protein YhaH (DUF805 family)